MVAKIETLHSDALDSETSKADDENTLIAKFDYFDVRLSSLTSDG